MIRIVYAAALPALVCLLATAAPAFAQIFPGPDEPGDDIDASEVAAYFALSTTPVGALAPMSEVGGFSRAGQRFQFTGHVAMIDQDGPTSTRNFALSLSMPSASSALRLTLGIADFACDEDEILEGAEGVDLDCNMGFFGGVDGTFALIRPPVAAATSAGFAASLVASLGAGSHDIVEVSIDDPFTPEFSSRFGATAVTYSAAIGIPLSFTAQSDDVLVIPHLTPRIGYGRTTQEFFLEAEGERESEEDTEGGLRPMLGAGVDIIFGQSGLALGLGIQKVLFVEDGDMVVGLNLSFRPR